MLQQTRVDQARPYFNRFVTTFPDIESLASATLDEVLLVWEGMGYYARARNLHRTANIIVQEYNGRFPETYKEIQKLPGIGPYTGAAILSIVYKNPLAVVDGNVTRVLSRVFTIKENIKDQRTRRHIQQLANTYLETRQPGTFNEALMELGATVCLPRTPHCLSCPLGSICAAYQTGDPQAYPYSPKKSPVPHYDIAIGIIYDDAGNVFIQRRPEDGLLGGLWEFPGGKQELRESLDETCRREIREELGVNIEIRSLFHKLSHAYTHFRTTLTAFTCVIVAGIPVSTRDLVTCWVSIDELDQYAFPRANRRLNEKLQKHHQTPDLFESSP